MVNQILLALYFCALHVRIIKFAVWQIFIYCFYLPRIIPFCFQKWYLKIYVSKIHENNFHSFLVTYSMHENYEICCLTLKVGWPCLGWIKFILFVLFIYDAPCIQMWWNLCGMLFTAPMCCCISLSIRFVQQLVFFIFVHCILYIYNDKHANNKNRMQ
jgi:hypothetical protein